MMFMPFFAAMTLQTAPLPTATPDIRPNTSPEIVVTARTRSTMRDTANRIEAVLPPLTIDQPLPRFTDPICPGVVGMARESGQAVVDRIGIVVDMLGLPVGEPGCDPNLLVIVTVDGQALVRRLMMRRNGNMRAQTLADMRRILAEPGGARAWVEWEPRSRDGDRPVDGPPPILEVQGSSRIVSAARRDIVSAIVVIDEKALAGRDPVQIADYAVMRGLADARPARIGDTPSVLAAFASDRGRTAPDGLTSFDLGILRGLYSGQGNVPSGMKRATMVRTIVAPDPAP